MDRRRFLLTSVVGALGPVAAEAQQTGKVWRVGVLTPGVRPTPSFPSTASLLRPILREFGYVEGRNLIIEHRFAEGELDRLPAMAAELVRLRADVLVAPSPVTVRAALDATKTTPIVMLLAYSEPVELGFVATFARPGGNVTGVVLAAEPSLMAKRLELLKEIAPRAARIAILGTGEAGSKIQVRLAEQAASSLGVQVVVVELRDLNYERAFEMMVAERANAFSVVTSVILSTHRERIIRLAAKHRLPGIYEWREHVEAGGLMAYGSSIADFTRRAVVYIDRIFKGASPSELPVERATTFQLAINRRTAKALGLTIPASLLARTDQIIE